MYRKIVLDNGLRVVTERMPAVKSVTIGIWVNVGSRDEEEGEEGFSHFIEHMFFKGTATRSASRISREIDALGVEMNAFTTRETTPFYVKVLGEQLKPGLVEKRSAASVMGLGGLFQRIFGLSFIVRPVFKIVLAICAFVAGSLLILGGLVDLGRVAGFLEKR